MYKKSKDVTMHKVFPRNTRGSMHIVLIPKREHCISEVLSYFVGAKLWDALTIDTIELRDVFAFKTRLNMLIS